MKFLSLARARFAVAFFSCITLILSTLILAGGYSVHAAEAFTFTFKPAKDTVPVTNSVSAELTYDYSFTCTDSAVDACAGATITVPIPEAAWRISSDGTRKLIASPQNSQNLFSMKVDEAAGTVVLTAEPGWTANQAAGEISFSISQYLSNPGEERITAVATFGGETEEVPATVTVTGISQPSVTKATSTALGGQVHQGEKFSYTLTFGRKPGEGYQNMTGAFTDQLPEGIEFVAIDTTFTPARWRFINDLAYNPDTRTLTGNIDRDAAMRFGSLGNYINVRYIVKVTDPTKFTNNQFTNTVTWDTTAFDGTKKTVTGSVNTQYKEVPSANPSLGKSAYGSYTVTNLQSTVSWALRPLNTVVPGTDDNPTVMKIVDTPVTYYDTGTTVTSVQSVNLYGFPTNVVTRDDGTQYQATPEWRVTFNYSDGDSEVKSLPKDAVDDKGNSLRTISASRANEFPDVKVTSYTIEVINAPIGGYEFHDSSLALLPKGANAGAGFVARNTAVATIGNYPPITSTASIPTGLAQPAPYVEFYPVPSGGYASWNSTTALPIQTQEKFPLQVTVLNGDGSRVALPARPTVYLTAPIGMRFDTSNPRMYYKAGAGDYPIDASDWVFEDLGNTAPGGGHRVKMTLKDGKEIPWTKSKNWDTRYLGVVIDVVVDPDRLPDAGAYDSENLTAPNSKLAATVFEEDQENYRQIKDPKQDTYDVDRDGSTTNKVHTAYQGFMIPSFTQTVLDKKVLGDASELQGEDFAETSTIRNTGTFRITAGSAGTEPLQSITVYDAMPDDEVRPSYAANAGDTFNMDAVMTGPVKNLDNANVDIRYSTETDPCRPEITGAPTCAQGQTMDPSFVSASDVGNWADIKTIRISFIGRVSSTFRFDIPVETPITGNTEGTSLKRGDTSVNNVEMAAVDSTGAALPRVGPRTATLQYRPALFVDKTITVPRPVTGVDNPEDTLTESAYATVAKGEEVTYTVRAASVASTSTVDDVYVVDHLPAGLEFIGAEATQGTYDAETGVWDIGTLESTSWDRDNDPDRQNLGTATSDGSTPVDNIQTLTIRARVTGEVGGVLTNKAAITSTDNVDELSSSAFTDSIDSTCTPHTGFLTD